MTPSARALRQWLNSPWPWSLVALGGLALAFLVAVRA